MIVQNVSRSLATEKRALFQRNCPVCLDKKETYTQQRKVTAVAELPREKATNKSSVGWEMRNGTHLFHHPARKTLPSHRMEHILILNGQLSSLGWFQEWKRQEDNMIFSTAPNQWWYCRYSSWTMKAEECLESF